MQISSNTIPEKRSGLEKQVQNNVKNADKNSNITNLKTDENLVNSKKGTEHNETSQYLKVLSRIENLLVQEKLPDAALDGFVGAIKNQIEVMGKDDKKMLLELPEAANIELENLDDLPELIKDNIRKEDKITALFKFLKVQKFAALMQSEGNPTTETYTAQKTQNNPSKKDSEIKILDIPRGKENIVLKESPNTI